MTEYGKSFHRKVEQQESRDLNQRETRIQLTQKLFLTFVGAVFLGSAECSAEKTKPEQITESEKTYEETDNSSFQEKQICED